MMLTVEDMVRSMNQDLLTILTTWQRGTIDAFGAWFKVVASMMPELNLYSEMPTAVQDMLGDPEGIIDSYYRLGVGVLALQREFVAEMFQASMVAPLTPFVPRKDA